MNLRYCFLMMMLPCLCFSATPQQKKMRPPALNLSVLDPVIILPEGAHVEIALKDWKDKYVLNQDGSKFLPPSELFLRSCKQEEKLPSDFQLICMKFKDAFVTKSDELFSPFTRKIIPITEAKENLLLLQRSGYNLSKEVPEAVLTHLGFSAAVEKQSVMP